MLVKVVWVNFLQQFATVLHFLQKQQSTNLTLKRWFESGHADRCLEQHDVGKFPSFPCSAINNVASEIVRGDNHTSFDLE